MLPLQAIFSQFFPFLLLHKQFLSEAFQPPMEAPLIRSSARNTFHRVLLWAVNPKDKSELTRQQTIWHEMNRNHMKLISTAQKGKSLVSVEKA